MTADGFYNVRLPFCEKTKIKFLLASLKLLIIICQDPVKEA
jgi:hypothetical protein